MLKLKHWTCLALVAGGLGAAADAHALTPWSRLPLGNPSDIRTLRADLDGDGTPDEVRVEFFGDPIRSTETIVVQHGGERLAFLAQGSIRDAWIVDLDSTDGAREIQLAEEGPSDDPALAFIALRSGRLRLLGVIAGGLDSAGVRGDGTLRAEVRGHVLQTWFHPQTFVLSPADTLVAVEQRLYPMKTPVQLLVDLPLVRGLGDGRPAFVLHKGDSTDLWATDDREWVLVRAGHRSGWFRLRDGFTVDVLGLSSGEVFSGLSFAD